MATKKKPKKPRRPGRPGRPRFLDRMVVKGRNEA